ncbi:MAG TPA: Ig-like domain-containing protein [Gemmatimonadaceae bacterium]|nr:Ig-like domain-containing protein [Gemmatimonadaceae bacterium]
MRSRRSAAISLIAPLVLLAACGDDGSSPEPTIPPGALEIVSGDNQQGTVGAELAQPIAVRVLDADGKPMRGRVVSFFITAGGGSTASESRTTGDDGVVRARWTLGPTAGAPQTVRAETPGAAGQPLTVAFSATSVAGTASKVVLVSGDAQSATVATTLPQPIVVRVTDAYDNALSGITVDFSTAAGSIAPASAVTDASGLASAQWTLDTIAGAQSGSASGTGLTAATFGATATPGAPSRILKVSGDGQTGRAFQPLAQPLVARVIDVYGNAVPGAPVQWSTCASCGTLATSGTVTDAAGLAQATWTLGAAGSYNTATGARVALPSQEATIFSAMATP